MPGAGGASGAPFSAGPAVRTSQPLPARIEAAAPAGETDVLHGALLPSAGPRDPACADESPRVAETPVALALARTGSRGVGGRRMRHSSIRQVLGRPAAQAGPPEIARRLAPRMSLGMAGRSCRQHPILKSRSARHSRPAHGCLEPSLVARAARGRVALFTCVRFLPPRSSTSRRPPCSS